MGELVKPPNLTPLEEWAWQNGSESARRRMAWAYERTQKKEAECRAEGVERAVHRAVLPGEHGLECIFYHVLTERTKPLRERVYIVVEAESRKFSPEERYEHFPRKALIDYQFRGGGLRPVSAYGQGRTLEVTFVCYSPEGSGVAAEAVRLIAEALEELREVADKGEIQRSLFAWGYGARYTMAMLGRGGVIVPAYRPPMEALTRIDEEST
jgi:hypothetical protein